MIKKHKVGDRVSRMVFCDDGTWNKFGDKCLSSSPKRFGVVISRFSRRDDEILVRFDDGEEKSYYSDGELKTITNWKDGLLEGESKWYFKNGQLGAVSNLKDNKREGEIKTYRENGKLSGIYYYKNGNNITEQVLEKREILERIKEL
jgi:hypothetical protein